MNNKCKRFAETVRWIALIVLLSSVAARVFIAELPFITNPVPKAVFSAQFSAAAENSPAAVMRVDNLELARVIFAILLLAAAALWVIAGVIEKSLPVRYWIVGVGIIIFAVLSMLSAFGASDRLGSWTIWLEQFALLAGGFTALQLCCNRKRFVMTVVVLAALAITLGVKGIVQVAWEIPARIEFFEANRLESLTAQGIKPTSPQEHMFTKRLLDNTTSGYFSLANIFAAELLILLGAAIGTVAAMIGCAKRWAKAHRLRKKGDISLPALLAVLGCLGVAATAFSLVATRSRGGIGAGVIVGLTVAAGWKFRSAIKQRWKSSAVVAGIILGLGIAAVCSYGVWKDRLPSKTMSIRWFYWTGAAEIVRERPLLGAGPGNFSDAYMKVRRPEGEEEVKTPHNFVAHAMAQYGLPGGAVFVLLVAGMVILAWRPGNSMSSMSMHSGNPPNAWRQFVFLGGVVIGMIITRWYFHVGPAGGGAALMLLECILPAMVFGTILLGMGWLLCSCDDLPDSTITIMRISLATGATAFVIHNFVSYGLWSPGAATTFWVAVGAAAGLGAQNKITIRKSAIPLGIISIAGIIIVGAVFVSPVVRKLEFSQKMIGAFQYYILQKQSPTDAINFAESAAIADKRDANTAANVARLWLSVLPRGKNADAKAVVLFKKLEKPRRWAVEAVSRNPEKSSSWVLLGEIEREIASHRKPPDSNYKPAAECFERAVSLNPSDGRLRLRYAEILLLAGEKHKAKQQANAAININSRLRKFDPTSVWLFGKMKTPE